MLDLSIIIVSYNARADLVRCLESLHEPPPVAAHEIIVVDHRSSDDRAAAARAWADVRVIQNGNNLGFARGTNIGIHASTGEHLLLLNSDTVVPPQAVDHLLAILQSDAAVSGVGPRLGGGRGRGELLFGVA